MTRFISRRIAAVGTFGIGLVGAMATPAQAVWIDAFDNGDPFTNSTSIGWATGVTGGSHPINAEPGRDGLGTVELASQDGQKRTFTTTAALPELGFFAAPTRVTIEDWNSWVYQYTGGDPTNRTLGGGTSNALSHFFVSPFGGAGSITPRDNVVNDGLKITHSNGGTLAINAFQNGTQVAAPQSIPGVSFNGTKFDIVLDLTPTTYTLTVTRSDDDSLVGSVTGAHNLTQPSWGAAATGGLDQAFLVFQTQGAVTGRYTTLSMGEVTVGIPEPATAGLLTTAGLALLGRRRVRRA